jgi:hypothetical protein
MSEEKRPNLVDLHRSLAGDGGGQPLEVFRVDPQVREFVSFTAEFDEVRLHFVADPDVNGYVRCNADDGQPADCALCRVENKAETRYLIPVYDPRTEAVSVLAVSPSCRPNALLPQLAAALGKGRPQVVFIKRELSKYTLRAQELQEGMDDGADAIATFHSAYEAGAVRLSDVFVRLPDEHLTRLPSVAKSLSYRSGTP